MDIGGRSGLLVLDKRPGMSSHDCVASVRRLLRAKQVGHCGTLDPLASGVLLVLIGAATARQEGYLNLEKEYWFRARLGSLTETGDQGGRPLPCPPYRPLSFQAFESVVRSFIGAQWQTPPRYAALKHQGKPYYRYAREGVEIPRAARRIMLHQFQLLRLEGSIWEGRVVCSRGTYIRTLVEDVAGHIGTGASLDALTRERIGPYRREEAVGLDTLRLNRENFSLLHAS